MTNKYGTVALLAVQMGSRETAGECWSVAAEKVFAHSPSSRAKGCPRGAFLGLCEEGLVKNIPPGHYTKSKDNKSYALRAVALLINGATYSTPKSLWSQVMNGSEKAHNNQMDVVLALWENGLITARLN